MMLFLGSLSAFCLGVLQNLGMLVIVNEERAGSLLLNTHVSLAFNPPCNGLKQIKVINDEEELQS